MSRKKLNSKLNELLDKEQITALKKFKHQLEMKEQRQQLSDIDGFLYEADKYISTGAREKHLPLLLHMKRNK